MEESNESFQHSTQNDHFIHGDFKLSRSGQIMHTAIGFVIGVEIVSIVKNVNMAMLHGFRINIQKLHEMLGHAFKDAICKMVRYYNWEEVFGRFEKCKN